jgi:hypothetical protein
MITDSAIAYEESLVRRLEVELAEKRRVGTPEEIKKLETELELKKRNLHDLKSRKRSADDKERRDKEQKMRDERRQRLA